ncbi:DUF58 domain-containing protein [Franzmannia qiaohouensis]|uniref:DUF58 domain-containing protein n=1 Tax=Franzmannia qiaohouensis TaxID=1329370 RepID=A0ABU1HK10_9GAMM|nr:DUF58 domain-containing protein [Halomonas qiaohouensis]MDR5907109.1 DUF58 domain-containing protein [Halomonas qiaohouensis]
MAGLSPIRQLHDWWQRRRLSAAGQPLGAQRLFLMPTRFGVIWAVLIPVLLLFGINYQNNLAYGLAFWLFAVALVSLWRGWRNLHGVSLTASASGEVFAGDLAHLSVRLSAARHRHALRVVLVAGPGQVAAAEGEIRGTELILPLAVPTLHRGQWRLPPLRLESAWPLGLVRLVAWIDSGVELLVYPAPGETGEALARRRGQGLAPQDFAGLRRFEPGDGPARLAWKQWSRTGVLSTKAFSLPPRRQRWLDYDACTGEPEARLSQLCAQLLDYHRAGDLYGLRLPGLELAPASGPAQRRRALQALARWAAPSTRSGS